MLYLGQTHTVGVPIDLPLSHGSIQAAFETAYMAAYGRLLDGVPFARDEHARDRHRAQVSI